MVGVTAAEAQLKSTPEWQNVERENRIFFMTDMQIGGLDGKNLFECVPSSLCASRVLPSSVICVMSVCLC